MVVKLEEQIDVEGCKGAARCSQTQANAAPCSVTECIGTLSASILHQRYQAPCTLLV